MNLGKRYLSAPRLGRCVSVLMSVIALALVCFPVLAHAECTSSSCVQYTDSIPNAEGGKKAAHQKQTPAKASKTDNGGGTAPADSPDSDGPEEADGSGESESSPQQGGVAAGNDGDGTGQGSPGGSAKEGGRQAVHPGNQSAVGKPASSSDDGSSPLVPILIAIAVLAAVSVAVVMIRQRRDPTATASPEAN